MCLKRCDAQQIEERLSGMAETVDFKGANFDFGPPPGLDEMVGRLTFFSNGHCHVSAWRPSPEEIAKIVAGEPIFVSVMSGSRQLGPEPEDGYNPIVFPMYVGCESEVKAVVSDTGKTW